MVGRTPEKPGFLSDEDRESPTFREADLPRLGRAFQTEWTWRRLYFEDGFPAFIGQNAPQVEMLRRIVQYVRRWKRLVVSGERAVLVAMCSRGVSDLSGKALFRPIQVAGTPCGCGGRE